MNRLLLITLLLALGVVVVSLAAGEWLTRPARDSIGPPPPDLRAEALRLPYGGSQQVSGWFLPGRPGEGAVLLLHGVRGNRLQMLERARWLQREGIGSLLIDLPSHGESSGDRISFGRREALGVQAALGWLRARLPGEKLGGIGVSLGGASLLFAERQPELDAMVLESVYPTITDAVQDRLVARLGPAGAWAAPLLLLQIPLRLGLGVHELRPIEAIKAVHAPLLVASGTADRSTRWVETEQLFAAATEPKALWPVPGAGHEDLHDFDASAYRGRLLPWLQSHLRKAGG
ncbi:alpha/beta hydrolase [Pelomonas sp. Root1237]|uniref:alpha/beta hydrolase n=1 Tax=Pelomonas sp. Root1237 TaxID=1736434 RepID=UPI0006FE2E85|nr:alpha/beta fold hydrolase [Pelomonas sp. Root1237]KQV92384.1 esterase [Pelomonas sp. Root1237]